MTNQYASTGETLMKVFVLLKFVRGYDGIPIVIDCIAKDWKLLRTDFGMFCKRLVSRYERVATREGYTYMGHREGRHAALSGIHFVRALEKSVPSMLNFVQDYGSVFDGTHLKSSILIEMGKSMQRNIALAVCGKGRLVFCGRYGAMDAIRVLATVWEDVLLKAKPRYDDAIHEWLRRKCSGANESYGRLFNF